MAKDAASDPGIVQSTESNPSSEVPVGDQERQNYFWLMATFGKEDEKFALVPDPWPPAGKSLWSKLSANLNLGDLLGEEEEVALLVGAIGCRTDLGFSQGVLEELRESLGAFVRDHLTLVRNGASPDHVIDLAPLDDEESTGWLYCRVQPVPSEGMDLALSGSHPLAPPSPETISQGQEAILAHLRREFNERRFDQSGEREAPRAESPGIDPCLFSAPGMDSLQALSLSGHQLVALPPEIGQLVNLTSLDLSDNRLPGLPGEMRKLKSLRQLDLSNNVLRRLPAELGDLPNLELIQLENNPELVDPPLSVVEEGSEAVIAYLRSKWERKKQTLEIISELGSCKNELANLVSELKSQLDDDKVEKPSPQELIKTIANTEEKLHTVAKLVEKELPMPQDPVPESASEESSQEAVQQFEEATKDLPEEVVEKGIEHQVGRWSGEKRLDVLFHDVPQDARYEETVEALDNLQSGFRTRVARSLQPSFNARLREICAAGADGTYEEKKELVKCANEVMRHFGIATRCRCEQKGDRPPLDEPAVLVADQGANPAVGRYMQELQDRSRGRRRPVSKNELLDLLPLGMVNSKPTGALGLTTRSFHNGPERGETAIR